MVKRVPYEADMRARAKAEKLHLVTLDINGDYAKKCSVTVQGCLFTPEEVEKVWEFMKWLTSARRKPEGEVPT